MEKLSNKELKFVEHYCKHNNATQAFLFASPDVTYDTARTEGSRLLAKPCIQSAISQKKEQFSISVNISKESLIEELTNTAEQAKDAGDYKAYTSLKKLIIQMFGYFEPDKLKIVGDANITVIKEVEVKKEEDKEEE